MPLENQIFQHCRFHQMHTTCPKTIVTPKYYTNMKSLSISFQNHEQQYVLYMYFYWGEALISSDKAWQLLVHFIPQVLGGQRSAKSFPNKLEKNIFQWVSRSAIGCCHIETDCHVVTKLRAHYCLKYQCATVAHFFFSYCALLTGLKRIELSWKKCNVMYLRVPSGFMLCSHNMGWLVGMEKITS